ncbi:MAG: hypothetical protein OCU18_03920 [Candidatus Syntrophoarchaeum sp.]|nr:hypothetical protein [Candidatus Syntrophoarchaeum sp.]
MNDTCTKECENWKKRKKCPNYLITAWTNEETGETKSIEDCAPKRNLFLLQELTSRVIGMQKALEQQRNVNSDLTIALASAVSFANRQPGKIMIDMGDR